MAARPEGPGRGSVALALTFALGGACGHGPGHATGSEHAARSELPRYARPTLRPPPPPPSSSAAPVVFLDPGHGAPDNRGNRSCFCEDEQDATLALGVDLAARLEATGALHVILARDRPGPVPYDARVAAAAAAGAAAFVSLHSDVRGTAGSWNVGDATCPVLPGETGFAVLFANEGPQPLAATRLGLARGVALRLAETGFVPYDGSNYGGLYRADATPGAFADAHAPSKRIFVLRTTTMPAILIETHHALDPDEAAFWQEPETLDAFAGALAVALTDALAPR